MKALVTYLENGETKTISFEAATEQTIRTAVNQWRVTERRLSNRILTIQSIELIKG